MKQSKRANQMRVSLRKRDQMLFISGKLLHITDFYIIMAAKQKFQSPILQFPIKTARVNKISTVPSDSTQEKSQSVQPSRFRRDSPNFD